MKNLSKHAPISFSIWVLLLVFSGCKNDGQPKYEDFNEDDFVQVPAVVTKITRAPIFAKGGWYEYNVYYAYNLKSDSILIGRELDVDLALKEGDGFYVLVHKKDKDISFIAGHRLLPNDQKILESYLRKSNEKGVKYFGVEEE